MKCVVLLALVGLASCSMTLIGGDRARDVKIQYTYVDENGRDVEVEVEADRLGLNLADILRGSSSRSDPTPTRFVPKTETKTRFVQAAIAPKPRTRTQFVRVVPAPEPETRFVQVAAVPEREVESRFVRLETMPRRQRQEIHPRFVAAPREEVRFAPVQAVPKTEVETKFVSFKPEMEEIEGRFVQVAAPVRRPVARTRFVEVERDDPFVFQSVRSSAAPAGRRQRVSAQRQTRRRSFRTSDDSSSEK